MSWKVFANTKKGEKLYYMNVIMVTEDNECAEVFPTRASAEKAAQHFKQMFHYETITPQFEEV